MRDAVALVVLFALGPDAAGAQGVGQGWLVAPAIRSRADRVVVGAGAGDGLPLVPPTGAETQVDSLHPGDRVRLTASVRHTGRRHVARNRSRRHRSRSLDRRRRARGALGQDRRSML